MRGAIHTHTHTRFVACRFVCAFNTRAFRSRAAHDLPYILNSIIQQRTIKQALCGGVWCVHHELIYMFVIAMLRCAFLLHLSLSLFRCIPQRFGRVDYIDYRRMASIYNLSTLMALCEFFSIPAWIVIWLDFRFIYRFLPYIYFTTAPQDRHYYECTILLPTLAFTRKRTITLFVRTHNRKRICQIPIKINNIVKHKRRSRNACDFTLNFAPLKFGLLCNANKASKKQWSFRGCLEAEHKISHWAEINCSLILKLFIFDKLLTHILGIYCMLQVD